MKITISKGFSFDASHFLPNLPNDHKCKQLHGHSYKVILTIEGDLDSKTGWIMDFATVSLIFQPYLKQLDHSHLNNIKGLENPTAENISYWIFKNLKPELPGLIKVKIIENPDAWVEISQS